jgi:hypothetical protein
MRMLQNGFVMGRITDSRDNYHELRLDVDSMSYEVCFSKSHEKNTCNLIFSTLSSVFALVYAATS